MSQWKANVKSHPGEVTGSHWQQPDCPSTDRKVEFFLPNLKVFWFWLSPGCIQISSERDRGHFKKQCQVLDLDSDSADGL